MKLNKSAPRIALLCGCVLLLLNAPVAQKHRSRNSQQSKPQTPSPTPTPQPPSLKGSYTLDDPAAATKTVNGAIEAAVQELWVGKGTARKGLEEANLSPPQTLTISYTSTEVTITTDVAGSLQTAADGTPSDWTWHGNSYKVATKWENNQLVRTFTGSGRSRINTYRLTADGKNLELHVIASGKRLGISVKAVYVLRYSRTS